MPAVLVAGREDLRDAVVAAIGREAVVARNRNDAVRAAEASRPGLAVVAADLPPEGGVSLAGQLVRLGTRVVLAAAGDAPPVGAALRAGVRVIVDPHIDDLPHALVAAARNDLLLGRAAATFLPAVAAEPGPPFPGLSVREREVLLELTAHHDLRRVARRMGLTVKTVRQHVAGILAETGAPDAAAAARIARAAGVVA